MNSITDNSIKQIQNTSLDFKRFLFDQINPDKRLIAIKGARGTGKTTLLLQLLKSHYGLSEEAFYVSLDNIYFADNRLIDFADWFVKNGGKVLFLDEVHKYPAWSREIKNIYDNYPELKVIFTGSSILEIDKSEADLSRRAVVHELPALSLREFISFQYKFSFQKYKLEDVLNHHIEIAAEINQKIKPLKAFNDYNSFGAYPFYKEAGADYYNHIERIVNMTLETDLPAILNMDYSSVVKIKKLLYIISQSVPFQPNISELSRKTGIMRDTLLRYLQYLKQSKLIELLHSGVKGMSYMNKPEKIYLDNANLLYALNPQAPEIGTIRETFFMNQLRQQYTVRYSKKSDFFVDDRFTFEIGGHKKTGSQIAGLPDAYIAADNIEYGYRNHIPLWMFGFLY
ncbi:MAG: AAA family ATPase [Bacteroidales bacterium]|nr:AAA family ATPase [Bacteroidales bacterium]MCF8334616.1 AAA family ATPase [Bacteroidales bacterium]